MNKKNKPDTRGYVYSTDPDFQFSDNPQQEHDTLEPKQQKLFILLDTKQRGGKAVTLIEGFIGKQADLEDLGKKLKTFCGTGGSVKDNAIIIQGDQRDKVLAWLQKNKFSSAKKKG
ncbi:MAG: translation initiation factor [Bacteroidetes bacterium]|nr:MAG: translation initiation factor [Bacteroidota bacterium]